MIVGVVAAGGAVSNNEQPDLAQTAAAVCECVVDSLSMRGESVGLEIVAEETAEAPSVVGDVDIDLQRQVLADLVQRAIRAEAHAETDDGRYGRDADGSPSIIVCGYDPGYRSEM